MKLRIKKSYIPAAIILVALSVISIVWANSTISKQTENKIYSDVNTIPANNAGLLLGTSKLLKNGKMNQYFENRIVATARLFEAGKIKNVVISGDNGTKDYNEPEDMKNELVKRGIPENRIYLDYAGFRTFDSVYRMKEIFGQSSFTVISQEFHNQRAVYIAGTLGLQAIGFNAGEVNIFNGFKTKTREKFARVKVFIDLAMDKKPKFLGEKVEIKE